MYFIFLTILLIWKLYTGEVRIRARTKHAARVSLQIQEINKSPSISGDLLKDTLCALKRTTLQTRASKAGSASLRNLWRLNNPFVSESYELQQAYRTTLIRSFNHMDGETWTAIATAVSKSLRPLLLHQTNDASKPLTHLNLRDASRNATLAAVFHAFFNIVDVPSHRLTYIGTTIHRLTIAKKEFDSGICESSQLSSSLQTSADDLLHDLRDLFSNTENPSLLAQHLLCTVSGSSEDFNPLNLLVPAFEAPWRAIFYTLLVTLQFGHLPSMPIRTIQQSFPQDVPSPAAQAIVYESLRLYPPIRRVRGDDRVDIEAVHTAPSYWGSNSKVFDPKRFLDRSEENVDREMLREGSPWMPFAVGKMKCPSAGGFSTRMIVVIAGEILRAIFTDERKEWDMVGEEWDESARKGDMLRAGRDEYGGVDIVF